MGTSRADSVRSGFTLVEMLAAMVVLILIMLTASAFTLAASNLLTSKSKHMDANDQARTVFDRMANDFSRLNKRGDLDFLICKPSNATPTTKGINDTMYFFTEASGYFDSTTFVAQGIPTGATASSEQNACTLVGYRVNSLSSNAAYNQLERLGLPLMWDGGDYSVNANQKHSGLTYAQVFLTYPPAGIDSDTKKSKGSNLSTAYDSSTIQYNYSAVGTEAGNYNDGTDPTYNILGSQIIRVEYAFQLKDGTMSDKPMMVASTTNGISSSTITATAHPNYANDSTTTLNSVVVSTGSRWWDKTNQIGYICIDPSANYAIWHQIGSQDVAAIIVTIAVIDKQGVVYMKNAGGDLKNIAALLPDYNGGDPAYLLDPTNKTGWAYALLPGNSVSKMSSPSLPQSMISQIRIFQRCFYLDNF